MENIKSLIPFFSIPDKLKNFSEILHKAQSPSVSVFKSLDPKFFNLPIDSILPSFLNKDPQIINQELLFAHELKNIFPHQVFSENDLLEISRKLFSYMKLYAYCNKKNIPSRDVQILLSLISNIYTKPQILSFGEAIANKYEMLMNILEHYQKRGKFNFYVKNPDMTLKEENETVEHWGDGSYLPTGVWTYEKQDIDFLPNSRATFSRKMRHPHHDFEMSVAENLIQDNIVAEAEFIEKSMIFTSEGFLDESERKRHRRYSFLQVFNQIKDSSIWQKYVNKDMNTLRCEIKNNQSRKIFSIACRTFKGITGLDEHWIIEIYDRGGKKIGQIATNFQEINFVKHVARPCASFISTYLMSELAIYVYAAARNMALPHKAICAPNANPWSAMRLSGNICYLPSSSIGQVASKVSIVPPSYFPTRSLNPIANILQRESHKAREELLNPNIWWETFKAGVIIKKISENAYRVEYAGSNFHIDVHWHHITKGHTVLLANDFFEQIQEIFFPSEEEDIENILGIIALAKAMKIRNSPNFEDFGYTIDNQILFESSMDDMKSGSVIGERVAPSIITIPSVPISYSINDSSTTIIKYGNMDKVNANLTDYVGVFEKNELLSLSPENNSIGNYKEFFLKISHFYESQIVSSKVKDQEFVVNLINFIPIIHAVHTTAMNANDKILVPNLMKVTEFDIPANKEDKKTHFDFVKVHNQKFDFSYLVRLHAERISKETPSPSKIRKIVPSDFSKIYSFTILCADNAGNPIFLYKPERQFSFGNVSVFASLEVIVCGYLPDFIFWVNTEGINAHKNMRMSSGNYAKTAEKLSAASKKDIVEWDMPFLPDNTMMSSQYETVKSWITRQFPSLKGMQQGPGHKNIDVLSHSLNCATLVDITRPDGYCPATEVQNDRFARVLRVAALLHDIGKASREDGGVGGISEDHAKYSSILAEPFASEFFFAAEEKKIFMKIIRYHDAFGKAQTGRLGSIDDAIAHLARIAGDQHTAQLLYHVYRCDVDSIPTLGVEGRNVSQEVSEHTFVSPEKLLEMICEYIQMNKFLPVNIEEIWESEKSMMSGKKIPTQNRKTIFSGEFVQKINDFNSGIPLFRGESIIHSYNPHYYKKMKLIIRQINSNQGISYARDLGMSYDGATGSIARCFVWTNKESLNNMFFVGPKNYFGLSHSGMHALVNSPIKHNQSIASIMSSINSYERIVDDKYMVVFDYHMGKVIMQEEIEEIFDAWKRWKQSKNGSSLFSLVLTNNDMFDMEKIALHMGYSTVINRDGTIVCADPSRIAIIGAYEVRASTAEVAPSNTTAMRHYGDYPATIQALMPSGHKEHVILPKLDYSEIFISEHHTHYLANNIWNGIPMEETSEKKLVQ